MGIIGDLDSTPLTEAQVKKARKQLVADFETSMREFGIQYESKETYRAFCLGVTMTMLTLKGYAEDASVRPGATVEEAIEAYYEAARRELHAD